jgi:hypothetical protein
VTPGCPVSFQAWIPMRRCICITSWALRCLDSQLSAQLVFVNTSVFLCGSRASPTVAATTNEIGDTNNDSADEWFAHVDSETDELSEQNWMVLPRVT